MLNNENAKYVEEDEDDPRILTYVRQINETEFLIEPRDDLESLNNRIWLIIRSLKVKDQYDKYTIKRNSVIKLGRIILRVAEIRTDFDAIEDSIDEEFDDIVTLEDEPQNSDAGKFCYSEEETEDNPKLCPGKGTGSMRYIHLGCLQQWLHSRKNEKIAGGVHSIIWKSFDCEICKNPYPYSFKYKGKKWNLYSPNKPEEENNKPFIILETIKKGNNTGRMVYTIMPTDDKIEFKLGRGHESDIRVNDISVSRSHMKLHFEDGEFKIEDCKSKFGTLVLIKDSLTVDIKKQKGIQVGRTVLNFTVQESYPENELNNIFNDVKTKEIFDSPLPMFGKNVEGENVEDESATEHIQNLVYDFNAHDNYPVIQGQLLARNEYRGQRNILRNEEQKLEESKNASDSKVVVGQRVENLAVPRPLSDEKEDSPVYNNSSLLGFLPMALDPSSHSINQNQDNEGH